MQKTKITVQVMSSYTCVANQLDVRPILTFLLSMFDFKSVIIFEFLPEKYMMHIFWIFCET